MDEAALAAAQKKKQVLYLCDRAPDKTRDMMVVFTSSDERWLRISAKRDCDLYMPLWTCEELQQAAETLRADIDDDEIANRYDMFGGVAWPCLMADAASFQREEQRLHEAIEKITDIKIFSMKRAFALLATGYCITALGTIYVRKNTPCITVCCSHDYGANVGAVLSKKRGTENGTPWNPRGSITKRMDIREKRPRSTSAWLSPITCASPPASAACRRPPEVARTSRARTSMSTFKISRSDCQSEFNMDELSPLLLTRGPISQAHIKDDGVYRCVPVTQWNNCTSRRLLLFQLTLHAIKAYGVILLLDKLGYWKVCNMSSIGWP
ncbi:unnamed protein product [Phytophthora lilii]|uniref:Unnamed protein product n=1 Tax=Phytophthora lilii TaxID=2077276 RepID=A0A9W6XBG3_9STRA|nr:unnamed protein product [Phytophthora lilii]